MSKFILQSDAKVFVPSYPKSLTELMGKSSILLINGSLQRRIHGLIGAFFKSHHLKAQITRDMQSYVQESMEKWREDQPIFIQDETKNVSPIASSLDLSLNFLCVFESVCGVESRVLFHKSLKICLWFSSSFSLEKSSIRQKIKQKMSGS